MLYFSVRGCRLSREIGESKKQRGAKMLYRAKINGDIGVKNCKIVGNGDIYGYRLIKNYFVDNSGLGDRGEPALIFSDFLSNVKAGFYYGIQEAGQFQVYIGEYEKLTRGEIKKGNPDILSSKKISKSCRVINYKNGDKTIRLYNTDILQFKGDKIILSSGGYKTNTTKSRINQFLPGEIKVYQKNFKWFINNNGRELEFFDGIEINLQVEHLKIPGGVVKDIIKDIKERGL